MRPALSALLVALVSHTLAAQTPAPAAPPSGHHVHLDVFAIDTRGRTVEDLKPGEFEIREEGAAQAIEAVRFVGAAARDEAPPPVIASADDERAAAAREDARLFAIFLDEYH